MGLIIRYEYQANIINKYGWKWYLYINYIQNRFNLIFYYSCLSIIYLNTIYKPLKYWWCYHKIAITIKKFKLI